MRLAPVIQDVYTDGQRAYIAGFLIWYRAGMLKALESVSSDAARAIPGWQRQQIRYYQDAESVTRYLLYECGYPVAKDENWDPDYGGYPT